jgi:hypothetical protein
MPLRASSPIQVPYFENDLMGYDLRQQMALIGQKQDLWCWATCHQMVFGTTTLAGGREVSKYPDLEPKKQCTIVGESLGRLDCCVASGACNRARPRRQIIADWERYGFTCEYRDGPLGYHQLADAVWSGNPVQVGQKFRNFGGHVLMVVATDEEDGHQNVIVYDPLPKNEGRGCSITYEYLVDGYNNASWKWTWTLGSRNPASGV